MARWFRFYDEALNDPKVQKLPAALFKTWVNLLCLASANDGRLGSLDDIAFALRVSLKEATRAVTELAAAGLLDRHGDGYAPHNWAGRQYSSDSSAERMRRHRQRRSDSDKPSQVTAHDRHNDRHGDGADSDTDSDTEQTQSRTEQSASPKAPPALVDKPKFSKEPDPRATRFVLTELPPDWRAFCVERRPELDPDTTFERFRNHWISQPGARGRKLDWVATFHNWVLSERPPPKASLFDAPKPATLDEIKTWGR